MDPIIGVDFDNTIVSYDDAAHAVAVELGLIHEGVRKSKRHVRDAIRQLPGGEVAWQKLQAILYGPRMGEARLMEGALAFFKLCQQRGTKVYIISHKTEYAGYDETKTNLRRVAMNWMKENRFFDIQGLGLCEEDVFFEWTRQAKIERIRDLGCTHFIDDLEETFLEDSFPEMVEKILYAPQILQPSPGGMQVFTTWEEISHYLFGATS
jgi:FMN phosphatase YigB (HAD superfamily)